MAYPTETTLTTEETTIVNRIRDEVGDYKVSKRDYYDGTHYSTSLGTTTGDNDSYARVSSNEKTYQLEEKGWPTSITINSVEYTALTNPTIRNYRYLNFSAAVLTVTGTIDVYYDTFRFSDDEILDAYDRIDHIPGTHSIPFADIPVYWYYEYSAIVLLQGEFQYDVTKSANVTDGDTRFDNQNSLATRQKELDARRKRLDDEIKDMIVYLSHNLSGVRVD
jgi:hypothetical protein